MRKKSFLILSGVFALLFIIVLAVNIYANTHTDILEATPLKTGKQNSCLAYDANQDVTLVGTYNNQLVAFASDNSVLWTMEANGPFKQLIVRSDSRTLYAGNEDNHVYLIDLDTGEVQSSINVQRRIYSIDVTADESQILVSAGVGTNKHNILLYSANGEQQENLAYKIRIQGAAFAPDDKGILLANNRAEIKHIDLKGEEIAGQRFQYELVDLAPIGDTGNYAVLDKNGNYFIIDQDTNVLRSGTVTESFSIIAKSIGTDSEGNYVVVGTEEGFLYLFDGNDQQIVTTRLPNSVTGFMAVDGDVYVTGLGDFVYKFTTGNLAVVALLTKISPVISALLIIFPLLALVFVLLGFGRTRGAIIRFGKTLNKYKVAYLLLIPTFVLLFMFNYSSVFVAITRAFTNWSKDNTTWATIKFIGLDNFRLMLSEGYFLVGIKNLLLLLVTGFFKVLTVPLLVAWLVYSMRRPRQKTIFRFLFVLPMVVPSVVNALMWKQIYDPSIGLINQLLGKLGLESLQRVWLGDERLAIWAIIFMGFPFVNALAFLVYYGGLMDIDNSILESAVIDGSARWNTFRRIQLPMVMPQLKVMLTLTFIGTVQEFASIYLLTAGGPGISTYVPGLELYFNATKFGRFGYACALGLVMFIFTMIGTIINMKIKTEVD